MGMSPRRTAIAVVCMTAMSCASSVAAVRPLSFYGKGTALAPPESDLKRYVGWQQSDREVALLDTKTWKLRTVAAPFCDKAPNGASQYGVLAAVGGGNILWACGQGTIRGYPMVQGISEMNAREIDGIGPGFDAQSEPLGVTFTGVGSRWIAATELGSGARSRPVYVSLTGETRHESGESRRAVTNLDRADLHTRLCGQMTRPSSEPEPLMPAELLPFAYRRPYGLELMETRSPLKLRRCGKSQRRLSRCSPSCRDQQLTPVHVAWLEGRRARVKSLRGGRVYRSRAVIKPNTLMVATSAAVIAATGQTNGRWAIRAARVGRR